MTRQVDSRIVNEYLGALEEYEEAAAAVDRWDGKRSHARERLRRARERFPRADVPFLVDLPRKSGRLFVRPDPLGGRSEPMLVDYMETATVTIAEIPTVEGGE